jgi:type I restriction enzyme M protein
MKNLFCDSKDLLNEAHVESFFINPLLSFLGYVPSDIKLKHSRAGLPIGRGSKKPLSYRPDYIIFNENNPIFVIDAKSPAEAVDSYIWQCSSYCLEGFRKHIDM